MREHRRYGACVGDQTGFSELRIAYRQHGGSQVNIGHGESERFPAPQSGALQQEQLRAEGMRLQLIDPLAISRHGVEKAAQLLT